MAQRAREPEAERLADDDEQATADSVQRGPVARFAVVPGPATRLTARGAAVAMFWLFLVGTLAAGWLHLGVLTGLSFVAGCALAARYTRRDGLLAVVASPALIFGIALVLAELFTTHEATVRRTVESAALGTFLTLAGTAPWLFAGVIVGLAIAMTRGLPQCFRDLSAELRGGPLPSAVASRRGQPGDSRVRPGSGQG